jgi:hypothetical protein
VEGDHQRRGHQGGVEPPPVIAGLDPAIYLLCKEHLTKVMDPRVKPAGDQDALHLLESQLSLLNGMVAGGRAAIDRRLQDDLLQVILADVAGSKA